MKNLQARLMRNMATDKKIIEKDCRISIHSRFNYHNWTLLWVNLIIIIAYLNPSKLVLRYVTKAYDYESMITKLSMPFNFLID